MEHNINLVVKLYSDIPDEQLQSIIKIKLANMIWNLIMNDNFLRSEK
ncbi:hypothetical protein ECDEC3D_0269 [Escherichia coli DEC3D]|nr:hypothetical protein ECDEC3D_0269 [Escherichia coli DEC3D]